MTTLALSGPGQTPPRQETQSPLRSPGVKGPPGSRSPGSAQPAAGLMRRRGERWVDAAARIGDAYGLVLLLVLTTFILTALVPESADG